MNRNDTFIYLQRKISLRLQETDGENLIIASLPECGIVELVGVTVDEPEKVRAEA